MGRRNHAGRFWVLLGLAYVVVSLALLDRLDEGATSAAGHHVSPVWSAPGRYAEVLTQPSVTRDRRQWTFTIPVVEGFLDNAESYDFLLQPKTRLRNCSVQVIVKCDHHLSYSHVYRVENIGPRGFPFHVPLRDRKSYWAALGHDGVWSGWNTLGLRTFEVKIFPGRTYFGSSVTLAYQPNQLDADTPVTLAWAQPMADPIRLGERFELAFDVTGWRGNFFDYTQAGFTFNVTGPGGESQTVIPFMHQNFEAVTRPDGERILPRGPKHFRARYRPSREGQYTYELRRATGAGPTTLARGTFDVLEGTSPKWVRISRRNPGYFELADGSFFYPVGWCAAFPTDKPYSHAYLPYLPEDQRLSNMLKILDDIGESGGNFSRMWISEWWNDIEWNRDTDNYGGIGRYNLKNAWIIDAILERCEKRGIRMAIDTLTDRRLWTSYANAWPKNPYFAKNGGWLRSPNSFWTDPRMTAPLEKRLAYLVARFADSPAVHCWGVMCEADLVSNGVWPQAGKRIRQQLRFIRSIDPYAHIITNHISRPEHDLNFYRQREIEFVWSNAYTNGSGMRLPVDQPAAIRAFSNQFVQKGKPALIGETGGHWSGDPAYKMRHDILGGLWAGVASRLSGVPSSWWWNFTYGEDLGGFYAVAADFMKGEDIILEDAGENGYWRNVPAKCTASGGEPEALMVGNNRRRFLYLYNYNAVCRTTLEPGVCRDTTVTFDGMKRGDYMVEYWDTRTGKTDIVHELRVDSSGRAAIGPPDFTRDWAVKIRLRTTGDDAARASLPTAASADAPDTLPEGRDRIQTEEWAWTIEPDLPVLHPKARARCFYEAYIALPEDLRGCFPAVADSDGKAAVCSWEFLENRTGWRLRIPASEKGPFRVTATWRPKLIERVFDERDVGLRVKVVPCASRYLRRFEEFAGLFGRSGRERCARVPIIDQVRNPLGRNEDYFAALYEGPLLIDADGRWTFSLNSDDGSLLRLDDKVVVAWLGGHVSDGVAEGRPGMPAVNNWTHKQTESLRRGMHWVEFCHQEMSGDQVARMGWRTRTESAGPMAGVFAHARDTWQVPLAEVLDGRIPVTLHIERNGKELGALLATQGLRLRRPGTPIHVIVTRAKGSSPEARFFASDGYKFIDLDDARTPVWVHNAHFRPFSLEWVQGETETKGHFLQTWTYDASLPLRLRIGGNDRGEKDHAPRAEVLWDLRPEDGGAEFVLSLGEVDLLRGTLACWPKAPSKIRPLSKKRGFESLVFPSTLRPPSSLPGKLFKAWYDGGDPPDIVTPVHVPFDLWSREPEELIPYIARGAGVLLVLDRRPVMEGLSAAEVYARLSEYAQVIIEAGALPIFAIAADHDVTLPCAQRQALAFMQGATEWNCPFVDLGEGCDE